MGRIGAVLLGVGAFDSLGGCLKQLVLDSDPTGALVTEIPTGRQGVTPITLNYPVANVDAQGCVVGYELQIEWASGAKRNYLPRLCGAGTTYTDVVRRPSGVPGRSRDVAAAQERVAQMQAAAIAQQQANAQFNAALAGAIIAANSAPAPQPVYADYGTQPTSCVSEVIGNSVYTRCR